MIGIEDWARYVLGLLVVLALIFLAARGFKTVSEGGLAGRPRRLRRLGVEEFLPLDGRRRLVLLRHDEREYLVLLGQQGETLLNVADRPATAGARPFPPQATPIPAGGWGLIASQLRRRRKPSTEDTDGSPQ